MLGNHVISRAAEIVEQCRMARLMVAIMSINEIPL